MRFPATPYWFLISAYYNDNFLVFFVYHVFTHLRPISGHSLPRSRAGMVAKRGGLVFPCERKDIPVISGYRARPIIVRAIVSTAFYSECSQSDAFDFNHIATFCSCHFALSLLPFWDNIPLSQNNIYLSVLPPPVPTIQVHLS